MIAANITFLTPSCREVEHVTVLDRAYTLNFESCIEMPEVAMSTRINALHIVAVIVVINFTLYNSRGNRDDTVYIITAYMLEHIA